MPIKTDEMMQKIHGMADVEKLRLVDAILSELDRPDPELDRVWAAEARKRWSAYRAGQLDTISYREVMARHRKS